MLSWNEKTGETVWSKVRQTFKRMAPAAAILTLTMADGHAVTTTTEHPFWVVEGERLDEREQVFAPKPEASALGVTRQTPGRWVQADDLRPGDDLLTASGQRLDIASIRSTSTAATSTQVFNLEVQKTHTYFVGLQGILAHNACGPKGSANPATKKAAGAGSSAHADQPGRLPDQLRNLYPESRFEFKPPGKPGQDVEFVDGLHPSFYKDSSWPKGVDFGDFKPNTHGGQKTFRSDQKNKWNDPTVMIPYNPTTKRLEWK